MTRTKNGKLPDILTDEEEKALLAVFDTRYPTAIRNRTMIKLVLNTGARISEVHPAKIPGKGPHLRLRAEEGPRGEGREAHIAVGDNDHVAWPNLHLRLREPDRGHDVAGEMLMGRAVVGGEKVAVLYGRPVGADLLGRPLAEQQRQDHAIPLIDQLLDRLRRSRRELLPGVGALPRAQNQVARLST